MRAKGTRLERIYFHRLIMRGWLLVMLVSDSRDEAISYYISVYLAQSAWCCAKAAWPVLRCKKVAHPWVVVSQWSGGASSIQTHPYGHVLHLSSLYPSCCHTRCYMYVLYSICMYYCVYPCAAGHCPALRSHLSAMTCVIRLWASQVSWSNVLVLHVQPF